MGCSNLLGAQILGSPPTPKTTKRSSIPFSIVSKKYSHSSSSTSSSSVQTKASLATLLISALASPALAVDATPPPQPAAVVQAAAEQSSPFLPEVLLSAPKPAGEATKPAVDLPEGSNWRYSEFLNAVKKGKVERVRFSKDGSVLQLTAVDGFTGTAGFLPCRVPEC